MLKVEGIQLCKDIIIISDGVIAVYCLQRNIKKLTILTYVLSDADSKRCVNITINYLL